MHFPFFRQIGPYRLPHSYTDIFKLFESWLTSKFSHKLLGPGSTGLLFRFLIFFVEILEETENDETEKKAKEL